MNAGRVVLVGLIVTACATDVSGKGPSLASTPSPAEQANIETDRRIAALNEPTPAVDEIRRSLEDYRPDLRRLAAEACGRVQDRECVVALGERVKQDLGPDDRQPGLDGLVARCGSGGREVLTDVARRLAGHVVRNAPTKDVRGQQAAGIQGPSRKKAHKKSADKAVEKAPAAPTDRALVEAVAACPSADAVWALVRAGYGDLDALLVRNGVPQFNEGEDARPTLNAIVALPAPAEQARVALQEAEAKARLEGEAHLAAAREALAANDFEKAIAEASAAESHGIAAADVKAASEVARASEVERHVKKALALIQRDDPDGAAAEVDAAERASGESGSFHDLREAIAKTPTARRREKLRQAEERRLERERKVEEARVAAELRMPGAHETPVGVRSLRKGPCRYDAIGGRIVARVGPSTYEFVPMNRSCVTNVLKGGSVVYSAEGRDARGYFCERAVVETTRSKFTTSGAFDICVRPVYRVRAVQLKNGFSKEMNVWKEDTEGPKTPGERVWPGGG